MRVFTNTAMSIDGRIAPARGVHAALGTAEDRRRMSLLRARADAVFVGGATFRAWPLPLVERPEHAPAAGVRRPVVNAVITRRGLLDARVPEGRWPHPRVRLVVYGPRGIDVAGHRRRLGAEVVEMERPDPVAVLDDLERRGCASVLVEGGGRLLGPLLAAGRVDEMHVTVCPRLIGGSDAPRLVEDGALSRELPLRLLEVERVGDEVFLRYAVGR